MLGRLVMSRSLSLTFGTTAVTCFVAAAQVWDFPYPRLVLGNMGLQLLGSTIALVVLSVIEASRCEEDSLWRGGGAIFYWPVFLILFFMALLGPLFAFGELHYLWPCFGIHAPDICALQSAEVRQLDAAARDLKVKELYDAAGPPMGGQFVSALRHMLGMGS